MYNAVPPQKIRWPLLPTYKAIVRIGLPLKLVVAVVWSNLGPVARSIAENGAESKALICLATSGAHLSFLLPSFILLTAF